VQGFRTTPGLDAGHSEFEFQAFQAGNLPPESQQGFHQPLSHPPPQPGPAAWASDFQRMHISGPRQLAQLSYNGQPQQRSDTGGWHQDFASQNIARQFGAEQPMMEQRMRAHPDQMSDILPPGYSLMNGHPIMSMSDQQSEDMIRLEQYSQRSKAEQMTAQYSGTWPEQLLQQSMARQLPVEAFDEAAFARAFEEAAKEEQTLNGVEVAQDHDMDMEERTEARQAALQLGTDIIGEETESRYMSSLNESQIPNQARLGADLIHDPMSESEEQPQHEDPDALARTAGQLLDSVRNNQSEKFQKSEFLELMRALKHKEVMVQGENIVGANDGGREYKVDEP